MDDRINAWVTRQRGETRLTLPHLTESIVNEGPFTRCGRRLEVRTDTYFAYVEAHPVRVCKMCYRAEHAMDAVSDEYAADAVPEDG